MVWEQDAKIPDWSFLPAYLLLHVRAPGAILFSLGCPSGSKLYSVQHLDKGQWQVPLFPALGRAQQPPFSVSPS